MWDIVKKLDGKREVVVVVVVLVTSWRRVDLVGLDGLEGQRWNGEGGQGLVDWWPLAAGSYYCLLPLPPLF